jgi:hypothetical protein
MYPDHEEPSCLVLPICLRNNINQFKVKLKSIYQNLEETTFDTNIYCRPTLVSRLVRVRDVILFFEIYEVMTRFVKKKPFYLFSCLGH